MKWLDNKTSGIVSKQCLVNLTFGTYTDEVLCDVVEMDACHLLLGIPCQYDKRTTYDGYTNTYTLMYNGKKKELVHLPPHKAIPPKNTKPPVNLMIRNDGIRELKAKRKIYVLFLKENSEAMPIPSELRPLFN